MKTSHRTFLGSTVTLLAGAHALACLFACWLASGCSAPAAPPAIPTFNRDIAPILFAKCATCHRPGEVAPFPLLTFADAQRRAKQIATVTHRRLMPPWKAQPGHGEFLDERRLDDAQIERIARWAEAEAPEGNPADLPRTPKFPTGWQLGQPDLVVRMPKPYQLAAEGPDELRNFVIPIPLNEDRMVGAVEFRPGNRRVVHHALCYLDVHGAARKLDELDPLPGYASFGGPGFFPTGSLGGWAPGTVPRFLPAGVGRHLKRGSDLVMQLHYHRSGKPETDQPEAGIYFVRQPATRYIGGLTLENWEFTIPAHHARYGVSADYTLPVAVTFVAAAPHMHLLGRELKVTAHLPDGGLRPLIWVKDWDFNWQDNYVYRQPFTLPKGTQLRLEAWFDNSTNNPANPSQPPQPVTYGEQTTTEMAMCIFEVTCDQLGDLLFLIGDDARHRKVIERALRLSR